MGKKLNKVESKPGKHDPRYQCAANANNPGPLHDERCMFYRKPVKPMPGAVVPLTEEPKLIEPTHRVSRVNNAIATESIKHEHDTAFTEAMTSMDEAIERAIALQMPGTIVEAQKSYIQRMRDARHQLEQLFNKPLP